MNGLPRNEIVRVLQEGHSGGLFPLEAQAQEAA